jgi:chemotaxis response regulator CheB
LQGAAADAAQKLIMLCQEGNTHEIQRKASVDILNRVFGMPNQAIEHTVMGNLDEKSDAELMEIVSKHRN